MRSLADQAAEAAELHEIRDQLQNVIRVAREATGRVDHLLARYSGIPTSRAAVALITAPEAAPEPPEASEEPEEVIEEENSKEEPFSVGRHGKVYYDNAKRKAEALGEFTGNDLATALGLFSPVASMKWLSMLINDGVVTFRAGIYRTVEPPSMHMWAINQDAPFTIERAAEVTRQAVEDAQEELDALVARKILTTVNGSGTYQYVEPGSWLSPNERPRRTPPEKERPAYELALATGMPVRRSASEKQSRRQRSTAGAGGIKGAKQRDRRFNAMEEAKARRAAEQSAKDKERFGGSGSKSSSKKAKRRASAAR